MGPGFRMQTLREPRALFPFPVPDASSREIDQGRGFGDLRAQIEVDTDGKGPSAGSRRTSGERPCLDAVSGNVVLAKSSTKREHTLRIPIREKRAVPRKAGTFHATTSARFYFGRGRLSHRLRMGEGPPDHRTRRPGRDPPSAVKRAARPREPGD